jgi:sugar phosphate isomerase/epimerase
MLFGVCTGPENASIAKDAGADFIEAHVQNFLKPADAMWQPPVAREALPVPIAAYNCFFPGDMRLTGPNVNLLVIKAYTARACRRAHDMHSAVIVLGSGGARKIPDDWPREQGEEQFVQVLQTIGSVAKALGIAIVLEPLNKGETNLMNTVAEGMDLLRRSRAPGVKMLVDFYHLALENEPLDHLDDTKGLLAHVHIAEPKGRVAPAPGLTDIRPFFAKLKALAYDHRISLECRWEDMKKQLAPTLAFLKQEWAAA